MEGMEPPILDETWGLKDIDKLYQENNGKSLNFSSKDIFEP